MTLLYRGVTPPCRILLGYLKDAFRLYLVCTRHFAHHHIARLTAVVVGHMVVVIHQFGAYLCRQQVARLPVAPCSFLERHLTCRFPLGKNLLHPRLVAEAVEVCIRLIDHLVLRLLPHVRLVAILRACRNMRDAVLHLVGLDELLLQLLPLLGVWLQRERVRQEVVWSRILVHAAHQVRDGVQEVFLFHHWRIEYHVVAQLLLCPPHMVGHTLQHLEAEALLWCVIHLRQQVGIRDGEEVVRSHTNVQHLGVLRLQSAFYDVQVVGIHLRLIRSHRIRPSAQVAHDVLHIEVAAFHDAHLDGRSACCHTCLGKLQQLCLEVPCIWQVGLHHDACLIVLELWQ